MAALSLDVSEKPNLRVLRIFDTSDYCNEPIENLLLEVLPVGRSQWVVVHVKPGFTASLNSSSLGYRKVSEVEDLSNLPDGIYEMKLSYKPNIHTVAEFTHLRTTTIYLKYVEVLCKHFREECKKDERTYAAEGQHLIKIKQYLDAAKHMVDDLGDKECGLRFYNQAVDLIKQFENECGC